MFSDFTHLKSYAHTKPWFFRNIQIGMALKTTKKGCTEMAHDKSIPKQGESSRGVKRPRQATPISSLLQKSKKKQGVLVEDQFHSTKFIDIQNFW